MDKTDELVKMNFKKIELFTVVLGLLLSFSSFAQTDKKSDTQTQISAFSATYAIDRLTDKLIPEGRFSYMIHHRFGSVENGISDLFGIYSSSNIRMGIFYGVKSNLNVGFLTSKALKRQELVVGWQPVSQNQQSKFALTYWGALNIDARAKSTFGDNYEFTNRLEFHNTLNLSRRFSYKTGALLGVSYHHTNSYSEEFQPDVLSIKLIADWRAFQKIGFIGFAEQCYDFTFLKENKKADKQQRFIYGGGIQLNTYTHNFQVFVSNSYLMNSQADSRYYAKNGLKNLRVGFNINVMF